MTELEKAANDFFPIDEKTMSLDEQSDQLLRQIGFKFGANWQKKQLIDKAAEWLNNFYNEDRHCFLVKEDIDAFIKAMED